MSERDFKLSVTEYSLQKSLKYFFALITIHVLVVYFFKNIGNFGINDFAYILIKMWKEIYIIFIIIIYFLINKNGRIKINIIDALILIYIILGFVYTLLAPNLIPAIWSFRSIYEVFAFYLLGRCFYLRIDELNKFFRVLVVMGCLTSIFAVIQVQFLGSDFFREVYGVEEVATALTSYGYENLRASSTFITPHEFGLFLVLCFLFVSYLYKNAKIEKKIFLVVNLILLIGLAFSLSRSSILILIICYGLYWVDNFKNTLLFLALCIVGGTIMYFIGIVENFTSVLEGKDPSSMGRFDVLKEFFNYAFNHPLGSGMGTVGVVVRRFIPSAPQFEGEIFNIFAMTSIFGGVIYLSILLVVFVKIWVKSKKTDLHGRNYYKMIAIIVIAITLRELILPRDFTNYTLAWFLIGSSLTSPIKHIKLLKIKTLKPQIDA